MVCGVSRSVKCAQIIIKKKEIRLCCTGDSEWLYSVWMDNFGGGNSCSMGRCDASVEFFSLRVTRVCCVDHNFVVLWPLLDAD